MCLGEEDDPKTAMAALAKQGVAVHPAAIGESSRRRQPFWKVPWIL